MPTPQFETPTYTISEVMLRTCYRKLNTNLYNACPISYNFKFKFQCGVYRILCGLFVIYINIILANYIWLKYLY